MQNIFIFSRNDAFMGRALLAAIDHHTHVFRKAAVSASDKLKYDKVYSKRSKNWKLETIKEPKTYDLGNPSNPNFPKQD